MTESNDDTQSAKDIENERLGTIKSISKYLHEEGEGIEFSEDRLDELIRFLHVGKPLDQKRKKMLFVTLLREIRILCNFLSSESFISQIAISNASGGITLTGVYFTNNIEELLIPRAQVVSIQNSCTFYRPSKACIFDVQEFDSFSELENFEKNLNIYGYRTAVEKRNCVAVDETKSSDCKVMHYCRLFSYVFPVARWKPCPSQFSLTQEALSHLQNLEILLEKEEIQDAQQKCRSFFRQYGSHLYYDDVHFGGIYSVEATFSSRVAVEKNVVKNMVQNALGEFLHENISVLGAFNKSMCSVQVSERKKEMCSTDAFNISMKGRLMGGCPDLTVISLWEKSLSSHENWTVIDRGTAEISSNRYLPLWHLIHNHKKEFKTPARLILFLSNTWEDISKTKSKDIKTDESMIADKEKIIKFIENNWKVMQSQDYCGQIGVAIFKELFELVTAFLNRYEINIWDTLLNSNAAMTNILKRLSQTEYDSPQCIKIHRHFTDLLRKTNLTDFPSKAGIKDWMIQNDKILSMKKFQSIDEWIQVIERHFVDYISLNFKSTDECHIYITSEFSVSVNNLLKTLDENNSHHEYILLLALVIPLSYDKRSDTFGSEIARADLKDFVIKSKKMLTNFNKHRNFPERQLAWATSRMVIQIANNCNEDTDDFSNYFKFKEALKSMNLPLKTKVKKLVLDTKFIYLRSLLQDLELRIYDHRQSVEKQICWSFFENKDDDFFKSLVMKKHKMPIQVNDIHVDQSKSIYNILNSFGFVTYFPEKLSLEKVLAVSNKTFTQQRGAKDMPWVILRMIISMNYECREKVLHDYYDANDASKHILHSKQNNKSTLNALLNKSDREIGGTDGTDGVQRISKKFHPSDVFLALFCCCDPFLKKLIIEKMAMAQLAVPFMYLDPVNHKLHLSRWAIREVYLDIELQSGRGIKNVTFLRVGGKRLLSKSKMINSFLRDQNEEHNTFFHKDCLLGLEERTIANGSVEVTWYMPKKEEHGGTTKTKINQPLMVLNLRGDSETYIIQRKILLSMSDVIIVCVRKEYIRESTYTNVLKSIQQSKAFVILITKLPSDIQEAHTLVATYGEKTEMDTTKTELLSTYSLEKNRKLNASEFNQELTTIIAKALEQSNTTYTLDNVYSEFQKASDCEDNNQLCSKARESAKLISMLLEKYKFEKDTILPLHNVPWQTWSSHLKKRKRGKITRIAQDALIESMTKLRLKQIDLCNKAPDVMANFVAILAGHIHDESFIGYFMDSLKEFMDSRSKKEMNKLRKDHLLAYKEYEEKRTESLKKRVEEKETQVACASFGLEHFFREMGQIYEAFMEAYKSNKYRIEDKSIFMLQHLPKIAAKMLIQGYPLELMDGDAGNVPKMWIKKVFSELQHDLGDKRLFRISVLGVQSTGKSTLLNTMFGLKFAVSAGRCTRGIFIQLLAVKKEYDQEKLPFDYVMVIDTEGLRAPELQDKKYFHDNELATFVIGLGEAVIINIKGETLADMENVLQIVVHAFLRLMQTNSNTKDEKLKLRQSAIFVHQNVSVQDAEEKTLSGNQKNVQNLDKMTKEVAAHENMTNITSFKQIISFNPSKHIKFVSDLWHGTPPMAPISPKYSANVMDVGKCIFQDIASNLSFLTIPDTYFHLESLWEGILSENFVFSFRNSLEVKAYRVLESEYQRLTWDLEEWKLQWWNDKVRPQMANSKDELELRSCKNKLSTKCRTMLEKKKRDVTEQLSKFCRESDLKEQMINWEECKCKCLEETSEYLFRDIERKMENEIRKWLSFISTNEALLKNEKEVNKRAQELAEKLQGKKESEVTLLSYFDDMWEKCVQSFNLKPNEAERCAKIDDMKRDMESALFRKFSDSHSLITNGLRDKCLDQNKEINCLPKSMTHSDIHETDLIRKDKRKKEGLFEKLKQVKHVLDREKRNRCKEAFDSIKLIFIQIDTYFNDLLMQDTEYDQQHFSKVLQILREGFEAHKSSEIDFSFTKMFEIRVVLHVSRFSFQQFLKMNAKYEDKHGIYARICAYRPNALQLFKDTYEDKTREFIVTNILCAELKDLIKEKVERNLPVYIQTIIMREYTYQKHYLLKAVLEDLTLQSSLEPYMRYINNPEEYVLSWLTNKALEICFETKDDDSSLYLEHIKRELDDLTTKIQKHVDDVNEENIEAWIISFRKKLEGENLMLSHVSFKHVMEHSVREFSKFKKCVKSSLAEKMVELLLFYQKTQPTDISWPGETPYRKAFELLWGCTEKCPWCKEPCQHASKKHILDSCHTCIQHRPIGLGGCRTVWSNKLSFESCNYLVQSDRKIICGEWCQKCKKDEKKEKKDMFSLLLGAFHAFVDYKQFIPEWDIAPSTDVDSTKYWNWFMAKYKRELAKQHGAYTPDIPERWNEIKREDAVQSLSKYILFN